jgi:AcrR family transcriptional regulator
MLFTMAVKTTNRPDPGERLLAAAGELFDREGIRAVGIDRLIADAGVARASLYQHFGSKDSLVLAYLRKVDQVDRARFAEATSELADRPRERIRTVFALAEKSARRRKFRGCLYVNALTEFPGRAAGVQAIVAAHREWLLEELCAALRQAGLDEPGARAVASDIQLLYDGALVGSKATRDVSPIRRAAQLVAGLVDQAVGETRVRDPE